MANREISQFATMAAGAQSSTMYLPIVDTSLGHVALANQKITLNSLFFDLGANTSDGATGMSGLLAAPSAAAAGKLKWYYNNSTKLWLASIDTGAYFSVQRSIAAGLTAGWLPYVDTGGILNGSANATLDSNGQIGCKFLNLTSNAAGLNSVAEINDSTSVDRWEIRLGASNQLIINDVQNSKDVLSLTPGATPVISLTGTLRFATDNSFDFGLVSSGRVRTIYAGTSIFIGRANNQTGQLTLYNSTNSNTTTLQAGAAAASRTYTWPTDFGVAGSILTDAAGDGTLSWTSAAGITGSIAANQVAYGSGTNTITGSANLIWTNATAVLAMSGTAPKIQITDTTHSTNAEVGAYGSGIGFGSIATPAQLLIDQATTSQSLYINGSGRAIFRGDGVTSYGGTDLLLKGDNSGTAGNGVKIQGWNGSGWQNAISVLNKAGGMIDVILTGNGGVVSVGSAAVLSSQFGVTAQSSTTIGQIIKLAAAQSASASQVQNSGGTVLTDINSGGMLTIGTASTLLDRAIFIKSPGFDTSTGLMGFYAGFTAPSTATAYIYNYNSTILTAAAAYTLTNAMNFIASSPAIGAGSAITTAYAFYAGKQKVTGVTTGYGIYQADSADLNYFAGTMGVGTAAPTIYQLQVTKTSTSTSGTEAGIQGGETITPASASTAIVSGIIGSATWAGTQDSSAGGYVTGGTFSATTTDSAKIYQITGALFAANNASSAGSTLVIAGQFQALSTGGSTTGSVRAGYFFIQATSASTITNGYSNFIGSPAMSGGATTGTAYGVYIAQQKASGVTTGFGVYQADSADLNYFAGVLRVQLTSTVGVLSLGGASASGAYIAVSTSSQAANDAILSSAMVGSVTGLLYSGNVSATATTGFVWKQVNTENATSTSHSYAWFSVGGANGGDPYIRFNISGATDWSLGVRNSDSDKFYLTVAADLSSAILVKWNSNGTWELNDPTNFAIGTSTGFKLGTGTNQKIGFYNATPVVQPATTGTSTGFTAGAGTNVTDQSTFTGGTGATAYRISDIVLALKQTGLLAA